MTHTNNPTEQQATPTSEEELRHKIKHCFIKNNMCDCGEEHTGLSIDETEYFDVGAVVDDLMQLLHQYGNTRELEGRISERKEVALDNYHGHTFSASTNMAAKFNKFVDNNERRIEQLTRAKETPHETS